MNQPPNTTEEKSVCCGAGMKTGKLHKYSNMYCSKCGKPFIPTPSVCKVQCDMCLTIFTGIGDLHCPECDGRTLHKIGCSSPIDPEDKVFAMGLKLTSSSPVYIRTEPKKTVEKCANPKGNEICTNGKDTYHNFNMNKFSGCNFCTPIQTGNDESWEDEYLRTTKRAILKVGENSPASQYLVNAVEEQIDKFIQKAVLQERESIKKLLQKECLDYCLAQNGYDYCKNCGLSLDLLDNKQ